jgi:MYXO-CTERM domain-containing protein
MRGFDWHTAAAAASAAVVAALLGLAAGLRRRRHRTTLGRARGVGERRIEVVAIPDGNTGSKKIPTQDRRDEHA